MVLADMLGALLGAPDCLLKVALLSNAQILRVFDCLLDSGDFGPELVKPSLHGIECIGVLILHNASFLDIRFNAALLGNDCLQRRFLLGKNAAVVKIAAVKPIISM